VRVPHKVPVRTLGQAFQRVLAHGLQHAHARLARSSVDPPQEALVHERAESIEHLDAELAVGVADDLGPLDAAPADEDPEPSEEDALGGIQEVVAPVNGSAEGSLPLREVVRGAGQERQALLQAAQDGPGFHIFTRAAAISMPGEAVQPGTDARHRRALVASIAKSGRRLALRMNAHRFVPARCPRDGGTASGTPGRDRVLLSPRTWEHLAAGHEDHELRQPEQLRTSAAPASAARSCRAPETPIRR